MHIQNKLRTSHCRINEYPFAPDTCLQHLLKGAKRRQTKAGVVTSLRLHHSDIKNVKYYEERYENGPDLQDQRYEAPLRVSQINA
jgi:hypothetical protein